MIENDLKLDLPIGEFCQLEINNSIYRSVFRGDKPFEYVMVDAPHNDSGIEDIAPDTRFVIRFIRNGMIYGFETSILQIYEESVFLWITKYPEAIDSLSLRRTPRVSTLLMSEIRNDSSYLAGAIIDLSEDGCLMATDESWFQKGEKCVISVQLPISDEPALLSCIIKNVTKKNNKYHVGMSFLIDGIGSYTLIRHYYHECLLDGETPPQDMADTQEEV